MKKLFGKNWITDVMVEIVGSFLTAIALYNFAVPAAFPMTGFSGLALILFRLFKLPIGIMTIVLNIPVAFLCFKRLGHGFFLRSVRCMIISSLFVDYVAPLFPLYTGSRLLAAVCTGVLGGIGYAIIYMRNSSTGGTDFIVMAVKSMKPHISLGKIVFAADALIILLGGVLFDDFDGIIYGMLINYIYALVVDKLMYGMNAGKLALVVTNHSAAVTKKIDEVCGRGTTILRGVGGYTQADRDVLLCACSNKEMYAVEKAIKSVDSGAFTIILESNEVHGEGFRNLRVAQPDT